MDGLQLLTLYLTLRSTHIFSGRKAKINLHTTPKLKVVMLINCLLLCDLFSFPVRKMMRSPLAFLLLCCMFSVEPRNKEALPVGGGGTCSPEINCLVPHFPPPFVPLFLKIICLFPCSPKRNCTCFDSTT